MLIVNDHISLPLTEIEITAMRAQGAGGQNVNKVSSAVHLRFDIPVSSLPEEIKARLLQSRDQRISKEGVLVLKAQRSRSQDQNRADALQRLAEIIRRALVAPKKRRPTRPTKASQKKRLDGKVRRGRLKTTRSKVDPENE